MITQATSNQSFVVAEDEEYGGEGLADAKVVAQVTDQSTAHEKGLDEVADGDVDIAQDDEIGNDELPSGEDSGQQDEAEFGSECLAEADSEGWICSSNEEEQNSASAVVHVHERECEGVHQMQSVPVPVMYCVPVRPTARVSEVLSIVKENDKATKFYTGLESWKLFNHVLAFCNRSSFTCPRKSNIKMLPADCLLLTLMRLRLNLKVEDLAYRFGITSPSVCTTFQKVINLLFDNLRFLIKWPSQETVWTNMPQLFKDLFLHTRCIIDCTEIFIEHPYSYRARAQTYSKYKKHNTVKFLIAITPNSTVLVVKHSYQCIYHDTCLCQRAANLSSSYLKKWRASLMSPIPPSM